MVRQMTRAEVPFQGASDAREPALCASRTWELTGLASKARTRLSRLHGESLPSMGELFDTGRAYGVTVNGRTHWELKKRPGNPPVTDEIARILDRMNGMSAFSVNLWELPADTSFDRVKHDQWPVRYLQAAGHRDRMTVELRRDGEAGSRHFVVGKSDTIETRPSEEIRWDTFATHVYQVEVFTAAEAVPLFLSYWQTNELPHGYRLRSLNL
jgi:hypothetical protein